MFGLFILALLVALAVALAPVILGVLGTMIGLFFTFILWAIAGFPDNTPRDTRPAAAQVAPAAPVEAEEDPMVQLREWEEQDRARARQYRAAQRRKTERALLDAQKRVSHDEP
jgi:hypothetical protein